MKTISACEFLCQHCKHFLRAVITVVQFSVEGYCRGIAAGLHEVELHVAICPFESRDSRDTTTGSEAPTRVVIEEFREGTNVVASKYFHNRY